MIVSPFRREYLYPQAHLPYGVTTAQIGQAVSDFLAMFQDINEHTIRRGYGRVETLMREATFSDFVGESLTRALAKSCPSLKRNLWNNGYPDLLSRENNPEDGKPRGIGIEIKASRSSGQWQAHNREAGWFMVFRFIADTKTEADADARPFEIVEILAAELALSDWSVSRGAEGDESPPVNSVSMPEVLQGLTAGQEVEAVAAELAARQETVKRRTRTTSTNAVGTRKLRSNPVYANPQFVVKHKDNPLWKQDDLGHGREKKG